MPSVYRHKAAAFPSAPEARKYRSTRVNAPEPTAPIMANSKLMAGTENENLQKEIKGYKPERTYQRANAAIETGVHTQDEERQKVVRKRYPKNSADLQ